jgi:hypothetical protein
MTILCGVIFCWNLRNSVLVSMLPTPFPGMPNPWFPNAVLRTS